MGGAASPAPNRTLDGGGEGGCGLFEAVVELGTTGQHENFVVLASLSLQEA